ncbi:hypothetical protein ACHAQH_006988 [Verticillium albo-atrum]
MPFSTEGMHPVVLAEVLDRLGALLGHVSYTVNGLAALSVYGLTARTPSHVTITCHLYARDVIKCWAAAQGMVIHPSAPDAFGVSLPDGSVRKVRLQFVDADVALDWVAMGPAGTRISSMPALLDTLAEKYIDASMPVRAVRTLGRDIIWLLRRIIEDGTPEQMITPERVPNLLRADFWSLFTFTHPGADGLFYEAGFRPPSAALDRPTSESEDSLLDEALLDSDGDTNQSSIDATTAPVALTTSHVSGRCVPPLRRKNSRYFRQLPDGQNATVELAFVDSPTTSNRDCLSLVSDAELDHMAEQGIMFYPVQKEHW